MKLAPGGQGWVEVLCAVRYLLDYLCLEQECMERECE